MGSMVENEIATLRRGLEKIDGVSGTWFEWNLEGAEMVRTLVVEVEFDTDPDSEAFKADVLNEIGSLSLNTLIEASVTATRLKVVPKQTGRADRRAAAQGDSSLPADGSPEA
jgi:hypothetical protein